jgi:hypothetical protein
MRTLPVISDPLRDPLLGGSIDINDIRNPIADVLVSSTAGKSQVLAHVAPTIHEYVSEFCVKTI